MSAAFYWRNPNLSAEVEQALSDIRRDQEEDPLVLLGTIDGPLNAEVARGYLAQEGIPAFLHQNTLGSVFGLIIGNFGAVRIYVPAARAEAAHQILSELQL
jgi:hypothetical protein